MKKIYEKSESIQLGVILALTGGYMDAYSYLGRGNVFANAQTGNILLLGVNLVNGKFDNIIRYLLPISLFILGVLISLVIRSLSKNRILHWRQSVLLLEIICFVVVAFIPNEYNLVANSLISFACGMQLETFRKIIGYNVATTMCIGNVREGTECLYLYATKKDKEKLHKSLISFGVVFIFIIGAVLGDVFLKILDEYAILLSSGILFVGFILMFIKKKDENITDKQMQ